MASKRLRSGSIENEGVMWAELAIIHSMNMLGAVGQGLLNSIDAEDFDNPGGDPADEGIYDAPPKKRKKKCLEPGARLPRNRVVPNADAPLQSKSSEAKQCRLHFRMPTLPSSS